MLAAKGPSCSRLWHRHIQAEIFSLLSRVRHRNLLYTLLGISRVGGAELRFEGVQRKDAIEQAELPLERNRQRRAVELQALLDSPQKLLQNAISSAARSDQIRSLVQPLIERI